jgi:hypothetical protein
MLWFDKLKNDMGSVPDLVDYFSAELKNAQLETKITGSLEKNSQDLPGQTSYRFNQLQELEACLRYLNIRYDKMRSELYVRYNERYNRELSDRSIEKYLDGESDIVVMSDIINEVAFIRNCYLGILKGLETKGYQLNNIVKLRSVGMNDAEL